MLPHRAGARACKYGEAFSKSKCDLPPWGKGSVGEGVSPPVLDVTPFPVGNNSMPPVASPRLGTSGCDYPGRIEFDKKRPITRLKPALQAELKTAILYYHTTNQSQESTCLTMLHNECCVGYWKAGSAKLIKQASRWIAH